MNGAYCFCDRSATCVTNSSTVNVSLCSCSSLDGYSYSYIAVAVAVSVSVCGQSNSNVETAAHTAIVREVGVAPCLSLLLPDNFCFFFVFVFYALLAKIFSTCVCVRQNLLLADHKQENAKYYGK